MLNGTHFNGGIWSSGNPIKIEIDILMIGNLNFSIIVDDGLGGLEIDELIITVTKSAIDIRPYIIS